MSNARQLNLMALLTSFSLGLSCSAQAATNAAELAKQTLNPLATLYSLPVQYNWDQKLGPTKDGIRSVTNIQPVLPFSLNEDWNLISRTVLPLIDQRSLVPNGLADASGIGDITQSFFFSPRESAENGWIWGAGPVILIPTGSDDLLSSEQWGVGPTAVALKQSSGWTHGILANHIWAPDNNPPSDKERVNQTFLQPFLVYTTDTSTSFGINTESIYNWQSKEWSTPINFFVTQVLMLHGQPLSIQAGPRYWVESPEGGADGWGFRVALTLLFPK